MSTTTEKYPVGAMMVVLVCHSGNVAYDVYAQDALFVKRKRQQ
jgi:hypothetical protein